MQTADTLFVDVDRCSGCGVCVGVCPNGAMSIQDGKACITQALCNQCEACGDALLFIGREVVPRVVDRLFDAVEGKLSESSLRSTGDGSRSGESGAGSRRRRRHRGG
jgi:ferredoxin